MAYTWICFRYIRQRDIPVGITSGKYVPCVEYVSEEVRLEIVLTEDYQVDDLGIVLLNRLNKTGYRLE